MSRKKRRYDPLLQYQQSSSSYRYEEEEEDYDPQMNKHESSSYQTKFMEEEEEEESDDSDFFSSPPQFSSSSSSFFKNQFTPPSSSSSSTSSSSSLLGINITPVVKSQILTPNNQKKKVEPRFILQKPESISSPNKKQIKRGLKKISKSKNFTKEIQKDPEAWINKLSKEEAATLFHLLAKREDIDLVGEVICELDDELNQLCDGFNELDEEHRNQLMLDGNALDYQLTMAFDLSNGWFRLLNTCMRSPNSRRSNSKTTQNFEDKMKIQLASTLGVIATNRKSGQCRPPYNMKMSMNHKDLSKKSRRMIGKGGSCNGVVLEKIWRNNLTNQISMNTAKTFQDGIANGFTPAIFVDNYCVIKQRTVKTSEVKTSCLQTITMMGLLIKYEIPAPPIITPKINFNNIRNILSDDSLSFNIDHISSEESKILSRYDFFHFNSLPLSSGKYDDFIKLNEMILDLVGDPNKPILMVQDSEFEAHHYRSKYDGKTVFNNNISCIASWHLMKHVIENFTYFYPDFMALILAPIFCMVIKFKKTVYEPFLSRIYDNVIWKTVIEGMNLETEIEMDEVDEIVKKKEIDEEEEEDESGDFNAFMMGKNDDNEEKDEMEECEEEEERKYDDGLMRGRHNLRDRKKVKRKRDHDFLDEEGMNQSSLFSNKPRKRDINNASKPKPYPNRPPPSMSYSILQRVARALVRVWREKRGKFLKICQPTTPYAKHVVSLLDLFVELVDPILQLYEGKDMRSLVKSLPKYACFFAFMGKWKFLRYCICQMHTFNELITKHPQFLSVYLSNGLVLSELHTEHQNLCISNGRSKHNHWESAKSMANEFLITAAMREDRGANYAPRMEREYQIGHHDRVLENDCEEALKFLIRKCNQNHTLAPKISPLKEGKKIIIEGHGTGINDKVKAHLCFVDNIERYFENHK